MSLLVPLDWEPYRTPHWQNGDMGDRTNGCFRWKKWRRVVVVSVGEGWEHASISFSDRCPTWDEMEAVKRELWAPEDTCMQLHVAVTDHVNFHPYCLHIWRPTQMLIPVPPKEFVA